MKFAKFLILLFALHTAIAKADAPKHYLSLAASGTSIYVGTDVGVLFSANKGSGWLLVNNGLIGQKYVTKLLLSGNRIIAGTRDEGAFISINNGSNWKEINSGLNPKTVSSITGTNSEIYIGNQTGVFVSKNNGESWNKSTKGFLKTSIQALGNNGTTIYAGTDGGGMYKSEDKGQSWTFINNGLASLNIKCIYTNEAGIFAGTSDAGICFSSDKGVNWTSINTGLPAKKIRAIVNIDKTLFAATDAGVFLTNNNGKSWYPVNGGLQNKIVMDLAVSNNNLIAAIYEEGVFILNNERTTWSLLNLNIETPPVAETKTVAPAKTIAAKETPVKEVPSKEIPVIKESPYNKEATNYYNKAMAEFGYNNISAAIELMNKAIQIKPDYSDALAYRGYFYNMNKQYDKAIADYIAADKIKKNVVGYPIACPFAMTGKKDEAFKYLEACLTGEEKPAMAIIINEKELESLHTDARWNTLVNKDWYSSYEKLMNDGNKKMADKDLNGALEIWNKAIANSPNKDAAYGARALTYIHLGNFYNAATDLTEAIRIKPLSVYYGNRAYVYKNLKRKQDAMNDYNKAVELDPQNMVYGDRAEMRYILNQKDPEIENDLKVYLESFYKDDYFHFLLGTYYYGAGKDNDAISALNKAISINSAQSAYYIKRGHANFGAKQFSAAIDDFTNAIKLTPDSGEAYYARGVVKGEQRDKSAACADWRKAVSLGYNDDNGYIKSICD